MRSIVAIYECELSHCHAVAAPKQVQIECIYTHTNAHIEWRSGFTVLSPFLNDFGVSSFHSGFAFYFTRFVIAFHFESQQWEPMESNRIHVKVTQLPTRCTWLESLPMSAVCTCASIHVICSFIQFKTCKTSNQFSCNQSHLQNALNARWFNYIIIVQLRWNNVHWIKIMPIAVAAPNANVNA